MLNNFVDYEYQPCHKIFTHSTSHFSIYLGDVSSALDIHFIKSQPIHLVVTAASGMDQVTYPKGLVKHIVYPLLDAKSENISQFFNEFYDLVQRQILIGNILVHCAAGISRSATLVISYFIKKNQWTFRQAVKMVRDKRPIILPNLGFQRQLKQFQSKVKRQNQFLDIERKSSINTSESKKNTMYSPVKIDFLPGINNLGKTALLKRNKPFDSNFQFRLNIENMKQIVSSKMEVRQRQSQHNSGQLKKKALHGRPFNKEMIVAKMESGRKKLLERSNNFMNMLTDNSNFEEPLPQSIKKLSSLSHRSEKRSLDRKEIRRNISSSKNESESNLFDDMGKFMVSKLQLCERKFTTQKIPRGRVIHKLGQF